MKTVLFILLLASTGPEVVPGQGYDDRDQCITESHALRRQGIMALCAPENTPPDLLAPNDFACAVANEWPTDMFMEFCHIGLPGQTRT